jgi:putative ABC transport system permease protein
MRAGPVARALRGGLTRRRIQTLVIGLVLLISTGASVLALAIVVDSNSPFDKAFAAQHGADAVATVDPARATNAQLAATSRVSGVTAAAGPFAEATISGTVTSQPGCKAGPNSPCIVGGALPSLTIAGRASSGGPVDDITLQSGHWATKPGQIVLDNNSSSSGGGYQVGLPVGTRIKVTSAPGHPTLTVVGNASSVTGTADGWVAPAEVAHLQPTGAAPQSQMLYRFASAATARQLDADMSAVGKALPAGTVTGSQDYLAAKKQEAGNIAPFVPFLFAFGVIGMVMSVLIVINVVSSAVVAGYRRIGILKSIGFTPGQVLATYTGQVAVPALAGCLGGVVLGNLVAQPVLAQNANAYGVGSLRVPPWVDVLVPVIMLGLVAVAALLPALRAARLSAAQAIATGRAPRSGRGYAAHRVLARLRLPRALTIGLAAPFARPARTAVTLVAVLLGATTVILAFGLSTSLDRVGEALSKSRAQQVQVINPAAQGPDGGSIHINGPGPGGGSPAVSAAQAQHAITTALQAQPGALHYVGEADQIVGVVGLSEQTQAIAFDGNASWTGYDMVTGHWYTGPGQVDVSAEFLSDTGKSVGDTVTLVKGTRHETVRIVGEIFSGGLQMTTDWQTLSAIEPGLIPFQYDIGLRSGTSESAYIQQLNQRLGSNYPVFANQRNSTTVDLMIGLIGTVTLLLAIVAGLGVLNTVVLSTRERTHDLGVFKAVGMTPRQTIAMVVCWVAGIGFVAGLIAVPAGMFLHRIVLPAMATAADVGVPPNLMNVYGGWELALLGLAGLAIAVVGALAPAGWAAGARTATALRAE